MTAWLALLGAAVFFALWKCSREATAVEAEEAIKVLLACGAAVELRRWHVYQSRSGGYTLLNFNENGDLERDREETFTDVDDAVSKFVLRTKL